MCTLMHTHIENEQVMNCESQLQVLTGHESLPYVHTVDMVD